MKENDINTLVVDDEKEICKLLSRLLEREGCKVRAANNGFDALKLIESELPEILFTDFKMPGMDGIELMTKAKELDPDLAVILITAYADVPGAVNAIKKGAHDYLPKPFDHLEITRVLYRALAERKLKRQVKRLSGQLQEKLSLRQSMGPSEAIDRIISDVEQVAESDLTVVIQGETGSGKELVSRAIHNASCRSGSAFVAIDCGAIPETLLESELFGHEKGAFTGALFQKPGKFEMAKGGTLLLDEILNLPLNSQAALLRVLQEKKAFRVGGTKPFNLDIRLLVASNQPLKTAVESGAFRKDLFYRLNEFSIRIPPLRERPDDIPYLANRFLTTANSELEKNVKGFSESAIDILLACNWPGNVRQLRSTVRRAVLLADNIITDRHLDIDKAPVFERNASPKMTKILQGDFSYKDVLHQQTVALEREMISWAIEHTGGNKAKAARLLRIDYKTIHTKVKNLGIPMKGKGHE
ncbi:MAG: sigma-54-dependent Fis family transcriptional regulator [Desulfobacteraceae bacterium]|nr:MAG: sigma-54-dependent Fis family transcriptional regulator [Desulfobacteraceae bacterium]